MAQLELRRQLLERDVLLGQLSEAKAVAEAARARSDVLLRNIVPASIAEELKAHGRVRPRYYEAATVMFADFKDFVPLTETLEPASLIEELNQNFAHFDEIVEGNRLETLKTIGDAYMCVGGLPDPRTSAPEDVVRAALDMQDFMKRRKAERERLGLPVFDMRVGIHTGPVVAGIVGLKKFQYDIWGDTVNTASRLESSGEIGRVNISGSTYALVKDATGLRFIPRGKVSAKGKGELEMFYVERMGTANFPPPTA
jgi:class 3 adenylate cyclase